MFNLKLIVPDLINLKIIRILSNCLKDSIFLITRPPIFVNQALISHQFTFINSFYLHKICYLFTRYFILIYLQLFYNGQSQTYIICPNYVRNHVIYLFILYKLLPLYNFKGLSLKVNFIISLLIINCFLLRAFEIYQNIHFQVITFLNFS